MLDEQTVPIDNLDGCRREDCGGIPGGVYGRCIPGGFMAAYVVERVIGLRERGGNGSRATTLFRKMKGKERKGKERCEEEEEAEAEAEADGGDDVR